LRTLRSPAKQKLRPKPILIVVVPPEFKARTAAIELLGLLESYAGRVEIEALAARPAELLKELSHAEATFKINVSAYADLGKIARSICDYREPTLLGFCHITQLLPPAWAGRAWNCFDASDDVAALTGMVATAAEKSGSAEADRSTVHRYLTGNAPALFALSQETNSGFVLMRSEAASVLDGLALIDDQYDHIRSMEECVHETLLKLHLRGVRFELVPDRAIDRPVREATFEVFRRTQLMRSLNSTLLGYERGSESSLLAGLAIDVGLQQARTRDNKAYLRDVSERTGHAIDRLRLPATVEEHERQLAMVAHACGQSELAVDLCAAAAVRGDVAKGTSPSEYLTRALETISVLELISAGGYTRLNLDYDHSLKVLHAEREIKVHANATHQGLASLVFRNVDLSRTDHFSSSISVPEQANPIRFRLELVTTDKSQAWSSERIVRGGETALWDVEFPAHMRAPCDVLVGVEMAVRMDPSDAAFASWSNPRFLQSVSKKRP
jgi:hypothetical protein